jgi:hypothetical protein
MMKIIMERVTSRQCHELALAEILHCKLLSSHRAVPMGDKSTTKAVLLQQPDTLAAHYNIQHSHHVGNPMHEPIAKLSCHAHSATCCSTLPNNIHMQQWC